MNDTMQERDLAFHPVTTVHPRRLSAAQIEFFNREGYVKPIPILDERQALDNRLYFDDLLRRVTEANDGRDSYSINGYHNRVGAIWDLVTHPLILDYVEDILGANFVCWGTHYFCKMPGDGKAVSWHQDASYWPLTPSKTVTVWLAIDDADRGNGCMKVLPGTHLKGHLEFRQSRPEENNVLNQTIEYNEELGQPDYFELKAGEISLHTDLLVHGSEPNLSTRRRCGLTMRYASTDVRALQPTWSQGAVLCRGVDEAGHWSNLPRPEGDSIEPMAWEKAGAQAGG